MGVAAISVGHVTWTIYTAKLSSPLPKEAPQKKLALIGQALSEKIFESSGRSDDGRTPENGYTIS